MKIEGEEDPGANPPECLHVLLSLMYAYISPHTLQHWGHKGHIHLKKKKKRNLILMQNVCTPSSLLDCEFLQSFGECYLS